MIGTTNSSGGDLNEKLNITLTTNQPSHLDISGTMVTVSYADVSFEYSWNGTQITVDIPAFVEYTVSFSEVLGYRTPNPITFSSVIDNARTITVVYQTELVTVEISSNEGVLSEYEVSITSGGTTIATQTTATETYKIPFGTSYTVQAGNVDGFNLPSTVSYTASIPQRTVSMQYINNPVKDLSMYDIYGNPIARSTANCYVVRKPGKYKFPLVCGNSIKNGKINTAAFTNNGGSYSHNFERGVGKGTQGTIISSTTYKLPVYTNDTSLSLSNWDIEYGISIPVIEDGGNGYHYASFDISNVPATGGNVVIKYRMTSDKDTDTWAWHIWLWPHDLSPVEITNKTGVKYNIMPVNLASKYDSDGVHIKNWFYQWGRPVPLLCPNAYNSEENHVPGTFTAQSKASYLAYGIANDTFFYNESAPYNWFGNKSYYNLWDAACTAAGNSDNDTVKTVYDPCPVGWKIPNGNTFTGLSIISNANGIVKMARYTGDTVGVDFPLSGIRRSGDGMLDNIGLSGFVWLSSTSSQNYAYTLYFYSTGMYMPDISYRAFGLSVRPVQDDNIQLDVVMISFTIIETTYQAESGMTWFEWVNSEYNTVVDSSDKAFKVSGNVIKPDGYGYGWAASEVLVSGDDLTTPIYINDSIRGGNTYSINYISGL